MKYKVYLKFYLKSGKEIDVIQTLDKKGLEEMQLASMKFAETMADPKASRRWEVYGMTSADNPVRVYLSSATTEAFTITVCEAPADEI